MMSFVFIDSSMSRHYHFSGLSTSQSVPTTARHDRRPLIPSFDHPLRKRLREIEGYDLENLLGYGPYWVNKDYLRTLCSAPKPSQSSGQAMSKRHSTSGVPHSITRRHLESQFNGGKALMLPKVTRVVHSYNPGNTVGASSLSVCPLGRSNRTSNYPALCGISPSDPRQTMSSPQHLDKIHSKKTRNEDEVLSKYCQWFDNLSSAILESNIGDSKSADVDGSHKVKAKNEGNHQRGLPNENLQTDYTKLDLEKSTSVKYQDCNGNQAFFRNERAERESVRAERGISLINSNKDEKDCDKNTDKKEHGQNMKNGDPSGTIQNIPREKETVLKPKERNLPSVPEHGIGWEGHSERLGGNKDELFVDKLVCIVQNYVKSRRPQSSDDEQGQKDSLKQEEEISTVKENIFNKQKEKRRRRRIEVLRKLVAQQESKLAKLKRQMQTNEVLDFEEQFYGAQEESSIVKKKIRHQDLPGAVSQSDEDSVSKSKKTRLSVEKSTSETKVILKRRWLNDWSCSTAGNCVSKASSI